MLATGGRDGEQQGDRIVGISPNTITRFERGERMSDRTIEELREALERGGVEFIPEEDGKWARIRLKSRSTTPP